MDTLIYIDPDVDLHTKGFVQVIIEFRTSPAHVAILTNPALSLEQATEQVTHSHREFLKELKTFLEETGHPYAIMEEYKKSLNGVALEVQGIAIRKLVSSNVIKAIYPNRVLTIPESPLI